MITDGQVHDVPANAKGLGFDAPVHALLTGTEGEFDRRIEVLQAPKYGIVGTDRTVELRVIEQGRRAAGTPVQLTIRREGKRDETRGVRIGETVSVPMSFPHAGQNIVDVEVEAAAGELTTANNRIAIVAEGVRENLRVLLVSGEPHAGERTWRNLLKSDAAVDLVHFTILRPPEKQDGTPIHQLSLIAFPTRELFVDKIKDFDLIIFDRYQRRGILPLLYYDNIARYVENGGALLVAAGDDYAQPTSLFRTPLAAVLPAQPTGTLVEQPFKARLSPDGLKHPVTRDLPGWRCQGPQVGPLVPHGQCREGPWPLDHARSRREAAADARPQGQGPRRAAAVGPCLAVGARLRWRWSAHRSAAPPVALADERARPRGRASARHPEAPQPARRAPLDGGHRAARHRDAPGRQHGRSGV